MEECDVIYFFVQVRIVMPLLTVVVLPLVLVSEECRTTTETTETSEESDGKTPRKK